MRVAIVTRTLAMAVLAMAALAWLSIGVIVDAEAVAQPGERYFIDFRARRSTYIGHTFIIYFRTDAAGRTLEDHHAGLVPEEDVWNGVFSPIRAAIRKYKDDTRLPATVVYRRELTEAEFNRVGRAVRMLKANERQWHLIFYNCNDFAIEIAEALGMRRPPSLLPPSVWVGSLRLLNER